MQTKKLQIPQGANSFNFSNFFTGQLPDRVLVGLVRDDAVAGSFSLNPFNFENYDVNSICLNVNGEQVPHVGLEPNFTSVII